MATLNWGIRLLNLAAWRLVRDALGPGLRLSLWMQGCLNNCPSCIAPKWREIQPVLLAKPEDFARQCAELEYSGITISGGEPFLQAMALSIFLDNLPKKHVICFSGYTYEYLQTKKEYLPLLERIDVLIDGKYIESKNDGVGLRGSSNQKIIDISGGNNITRLETMPRIVEVFTEPDGYLLAGIPDKKFLAGINRFFGQ